MDLVNTLVGSPARIAGTSTTVAIAGTSVGFGADYLLKNKHSDKPYDHLPEYDEGTIGKDFGIWALSLNLDQESWKSNLGKLRGFTGKDFNLNNELKKIKDKNTDDQEELKTWCKNAYQTKPVNKNQDFYKNATAFCRRVDIRKFIGSSKDVLTVVVNNKQTSYRDKLKILLVKQEEMTPELRELKKKTPSSVTGTTSINDIDNFCMNRLKRPFVSEKDQEYLEAVLYCTREFK